MDKIILASGSPRRSQLLGQAGYTFEVISADVDETNPTGMPGMQVPEFLARKKAEAVAIAHPDRLIIAADTVVLLGNDILGKPLDTEDAKLMLGRLSGQMHRVVTGVCIRQGDTIESFSNVTEVYFSVLTETAIDYYIREFRPFDKAGSYAIQEWIGLTGINRINGDYYNVMGLPISEVVLKLEALGYSGKSE